jgi:hypothetical protein
MTVLSVRIGRSEADAAPAGRDDASPHAASRSFPPVIRIYDAAKETVDLRTGLTAPGIVSAADIRRFVTAALPGPAELEDSSSDKLP